MKIPDGYPICQLNRSAFTPTAVALPDMRFCIALTVSRPVIVPFESTGFSA